MITRFEVGKWYRCLLKEPRETWDPNRGMHFLLDGKPHRVSWTGVVRVFSLFTSVSVDFEDYPRYLFEPSRWAYLAHRWGLPPVIIARIRKLEGRRMGWILRLCDFEECDPPAEKARR
jgi:hypothetical protein